MIYIVRFILQIKERDSMIVEPNLAQIGWNKIDGDLVIYNPNDEKYFVLNESAALIWEYLVDKGSSCGPEMIINLLLSEYDCSDAEMVSQDVFELLNIMKQQGLVDLKTAI